ncbi:MAG TPA: MFS transporter [Streptosporangiaceae bacterium]|nr:MFS transporter [Streptosporangiaceae bacterium]
MFTRALTRRFPVLSNRNFRLLLADRLLAPMAATFSLVGVSFAVLAATGSTADLSYVIAAQAAPSLVFLLVGGVIADRIAPQLVIVAANVMVAAGEGTFGILVLTSHPAVWVMIALELMTGTGVALFYPASMALLPRLVTTEQMREASAISRLTMNAAMMAGAALAGECVALFGAGWALAVCGVGMFATVPLLLAIKAAPLDRPETAGGHEHAPSMFRELREGWSEFRSHTWLWATVLQFTVVLAAWCGGFQVLGPAVARAHLGGAAAWGLISAAEATGLIVGGLVSLRWSPSRPILYVVLIGAAIAISPLSLAMLLPLPVICVTSFLLGVAIETMAVLWTVTMAAKIPADKLARVSAYDGLGTTMGMPVGALVAGPLASRIGVPATQYGAAAITLVASALALIPRDVRTMRSGPVQQETVEPAPAGAILEEPVLAEAAPAGPALVEPALSSTG